MPPDRRPSANSGRPQRPGRPARPGAGSGRGPAHRSGRGSSGRGSSSGRDGACTAPSTLDGPPRRAGDGRVERSVASTGRWLPRRGTGRALTQRTVHGAYGGSDDRPTTGYAPHDRALAARRAPPMTATTAARSGPGEAAIALAVRRSTTRDRPTSVRLGDALARLAGLARARGGRDRCRRGASSAAHCSADPLRGGQGRPWRARASSAGCTAAVGTRAVGRRRSAAVCGSAGHRARAASGSGRRQQCRRGQAGSPAQVVGPCTGSRRGAHQDRPGRTRCEVPGALDHRGRRLGPRPLRRRPSHGAIGAARPARDGVRSRDRRPCVLPNRAVAQGRRRARAGTPTRSHRSTTMRCWPIATGR